MSKYRIKEVRKTLNDGKTKSIFYIYRPLLFFWKRYEVRWDSHEWVKRVFLSLEEAKEYVKSLELEQELECQNKVKKKETIIHKL